MKSRDEYRDALRYLAQQSERSNLLWVVPGRGAATAGETTSRDGGESSASQVGVDPDSPGDAAGASGSSEASLADQGVQGGRGAEVEEWPRGAPEPVATIPIPNRIEDAFPDYRDLASFEGAINKCMKCSLGATRNKFVFGVGDPEARLVLVGESPGADEDAQGEPFVGRAGKLLDQILEAVNLRRGKDVYIANILKCRPPGNRDPLPPEVEGCEPYLVKQLQIIRPKLIVALGRIAAQTMLRTTAPLGRLRGKLHDYHGIPLMATFHPAALLRNPKWKRPTWEDVQEMRRLLDEESA